MRLDRYIAWEWLKVFVLSLAAIVGILVIDDIQDDMQDLVGYGAQAQEIAYYYMVRFPSFLPVVLPVAFMVSLLFLLGQLHRNLEVTALLAAGLSYGRITRSLWVAALGLSGLMWYLNANLVPWSTETARLLWDNHRYAYAAESGTDAREIGLVSNLTFNNAEAGRIWYLNRFNQHSFMAEGITIAELGEGGRETRRWLANSGWYDDLRGHWVLVDGREMAFDGSGLSPLYSKPFNKVEADWLREDPVLMRALEKRPKDLSLRELGAILALSGTEGDPSHRRYLVSFYDRLLSPLSCLIVAGFAIPFALRGVRTHPFVGISKAMGWFLLYYIFVQLAQAIGTSGIEPLWAAALPNLVAGGFVVYLLSGMRRPQ